SCERTRRGQPGAGEDAIEEGRLAVDVVVERSRFDPELRAELPHAQRVGALAIDERERGSEQPIVRHGPSHGPLGERLTLFGFVSQTPYIVRAGYATPEPRLEAPEPASRALRWPPRDTARGREHARSKRQSR